MEKKVQFNLIGRNDIEDIFSVILENRGISTQDKELLLNPSESSLIDPNNLKNIDEGISLLFTHIKAQREALKEGKEHGIMVVVDSDMDGYTSATVILDFLQRVLKTSVSWFIHKGKEHGITEEMKNHAIESGAKLIIAPDASSNDWAMHKTLKELGIDVLVLDHHEIEVDSDAIQKGLCSDLGESTNAVVINPLLSPNYPNKQISGVGVTFKFVEAICKLVDFPSEYYLNYLDLVAMGNVADMMDLRSPETRYLVYEGLKYENIKNPLLKEMVDSYSEGELTPERISWDIAPKVNGLIRAGKLEEKQRMMEALLGINYEVTRTWRGKTYVESLPECVTREAKNAHSRSKNLKNKIANEAIEKARELGILEEKVLIIPMDKIQSGMSGIVAQEISSTLKKPVSIVSPDKRGNFAGSVRGYDPVHTDIKSLFIESNLVNFARGHGQAHGVSFPQENHLELIKTVSNLVGNTVVGLPVDFILGERYINTSLVKQVDSYSKYFGKGIEKPKFVFTDIEIKPQMASFTANAMTIDFNGVQIVAFKKDIELEELLEGQNKVTLDIVGSLGTGQWRGRARHQLQVDSLIIKAHEPYTAESIPTGFGITF